MVVVLHAAMELYLGGLRVIFFGVDLFSLIIPKADHVIAERDEKKGPRSDAVFGVLRISRTTRASIAGNFLEEHTRCTQ